MAPPPPRPTRKTFHTKFRCVGSRVYNNVSSPRKTVHRLRFEPFVRIAIRGKEEEESGSNWSLDRGLFDRKETVRPKKKKKGGKRKGRETVESVEKSKSTRRLVCALSRRDALRVVFNALRPAELTSSFPRWVIRGKKKEKKEEEGKKERERERKKRIMNMHRADPATTVCRHFAPGCEGPGSLRSSCTVNRARLRCSCTSNLQLLQLTCRAASSNRPEIRANRDSCRVSLSPPPSFPCLETNRFLSPHVRNSSNSSNGSNSDEID